jgi:hypothetical protein
VNVARGAVVWCNISVQGRVHCRSSGSEVGVSGSGGGGEGEGEDKGGEWRAGPSKRGYNILAGERGAGCLDQYYVVTGATDGRTGWMNEMQGQV